VCLRFRASILWAQFVSNDGKEAMLGWHSFHASVEKHETPCGQKHTKGKGSPKKPTMFISNGRNLK